MESKLRYSTRVESLLKSMSPRSLILNILDWIDDTQIERPVGDTEQTRIKYSKLLDKPPSKPALLRDIQNDWPAGLSYRQLTVSHYNAWKDKPLSYEWRVFKVLNSKKVSLSQFVLNFERSLAVTHQYTLYMQFLPSTARSIEKTPIFTLIMHAEAGEDIPPPSQRVMFVPLLAAGKLMTTAISTIHEEHIVSAWLGAFGNAEDMKNLQLYDTNLEALKSLTLEPKTQGIWRKLASSVDELPKPLQEAPSEAKPNAMISKEDIEPSSLGEDYDSIIKQSTTDDDSRRRYEAMDIFGREEDLPHIQRMTFHVRMPWRIKQDTDNLDCKIRMHGQDVFRGLRQAVVNGQTTSEGLPGWLPQAMTTGHTDNIMVKTSRVSDKWQYVEFGEHDEDNVFGPNLDRYEEMEPELKSRTPSPPASPATRKRKREAASVVHEQQRTRQRERDMREVERRFETSSSISRAETSSAARSM